ncbi:hypothetical protein AXG93_1593s1590 [Marchantia polymorpha subsp. ruderalis]|uniref:Uncharacterized protein n=1 Tax=Marchantia polymorpha subsp. ruderalis TaxID=1480154 RepID=A0A176WM26_MARPO|nr:hypothetical protein AXG93_1593s1590 [Marchantia polymorpha subsp. ruderalis]
MVAVLNFALQHALERIPSNCGRLGRSNTRQGIGSTPVLSIPPGRAIGNEIEAHMKSVTISRYQSDVIITKLEAGTVEHCHNDIHTKLRLRNEPISFMRLVGGEGRVGITEKRLAPVLPIPPERGLYGTGIRQRQLSRLTWGKSHRYRFALITNPWQAMLPTPCDWEIDQKKRFSISAVAPDRGRTYDFLLRKQTLYPLSYRRLLY